MRYPEPTFLTGREKKNVFQKDNCERIGEILQKLLYNTRPLGPLQPRQYYSTRSASSSHKISGSAVKAILTIPCFFDVIRKTSK
jgi:hypothetical protein